MSIPRVRPGRGSPRERGRLTLPHDRRVTPQLELRLGALVVYGSHGLGRITRLDASCDREPASGTIVLEFSNGLSVTLPHDRAVTCLRSVSDTNELARVRNVLRCREVAVEKSWQARTKSTKTKIAAGQAVGLAEVVRDTVVLGRESATGTVSMYERDLYLRARRLLAAEIGAATNADAAEAEEWIDTQLETWDGGGDEHGAA